MGDGESTECVCVCTSLYHTAAGSWVPRAVPLTYSIIILPYIYIYIRIVSAVGYTHDDDNEDYYYDGFEKISPAAALAIQ